MFVTFDKNKFYVRSDNGLILSIKEIPEGIIQAVLSGNTITVTTDGKGILVYKQVGKSPVFNFHRRY